MTYIPTKDIGWGKANKRLLLYWMNDPFLCGCVKRAVDLFKVKQKDAQTGSLYFLLIPLTNAT